MERDDADVVVIGSGAGGLTTAVALANAGRQVLVLEQHDRPGGWCHSFKRRGFEFSPGVHYLGELGPGQLFREIFKGLGITADLELSALNPDGFEHINIGGQQVDVPAGRERYRMLLRDRFAGDRRSIDRYFRLMQRVCEEFMAAGDYAKGWKVVQLPFRVPNFLLHGSKLLAPYMEHLTLDPLLKNFLAAPSGIYGLPPSQTTLLLHSTLLHHYGEGAYYPRGGARSIPAAMSAQLTRRGGAIRTSTTVEQIMIEGGRAVGVRMAGGETISARTVVSNADPEMTLRRLVGEQYLPRKLRQRLERTSYSASCLSLFVATDLDLRGMGLDSGNYWYYARPDVEGIFNTLQARVPDPLEFVFVSIPTLKDPTLRSDGLHTVEIFTLVPYGPFQRWAQQPWGQRDAAYQELKQQLTARLLALAERVIPGLGGHLVYHELGTPLTNEHFCRSHQGAMYGVAKVRDQVGTKSFPTTTPIPGLHMVGASTFFHGVMGATVSGVMASSEILGRSFEEVLSERGPEPTVIDAEPDSSRLALAAAGSGG